MTYVDHGFTLPYFLVCPIKDISIASDYYVFPDLPTYVTKPTA